MRGDPGVDDEGFGVADVGEVAAELEVVDDGADFVDVAGLVDGLVAWNYHIRVRCRDRVRDYIRRQR